MKVKRIIQKDRSAVSTIAVIAIVLILVVAAGVAYIVLTGDSGDDDKVAEEVAPGTMLKYEVYEKAAPKGKDTLAGTWTFDYIGQSADTFFISVSGDYHNELFQYYKVDPKGASDDMEKIGTAEIDTMDGLRSVEIWSTDGGKTNRAYYDAETGLGYLHETDTEDGVFTQKLVDYEFKWQKSYKESKSIGKTYKYVDKATGLSMEIRCIADCLNGQFGIIYDFSALGWEDEYFLSDYAQGLPANATDREEPAYISTIDGKKTVQSWDWEDGIITFGYEPRSHIIYVVLIPLGEEEDDQYYFELSKKP